MDRLCLDRVGIPDSLTTFRAGDVASSARSSISVRILRPVSLLALASCALAAQADTTIGTGSAPIVNYTFNWAYTAQTFLVPSDSVLKGYSFSLGPAGGTIGLSVYAWSGTDAVGPALYSTSLASSGTGDYAVGGIDLALTSGSLYAAVFDLRALDAGRENVGFVYDAYADGEAYWRQENGDYQQYGLDHRFGATFGSPSVASAPGPMAALPFALMALRRRKRA